MKILLWLRVLSAVPSPLQRLVPTQDQRLWPPPFVLKPASVRVSHIFYCRKHSVSSFSVCVDEPVKQLLIHIFPRLGKPFIQFPVFKSRQEHISRIIYKMSKAVDILVPNGVETGVSFVMAELCARFADPDVLNP